MTPIGKVTEVFDAIQRAKEGASGFVTNFFPVQDKLQGWVDHGELFAELCDGSAFFWRKDRDFWHLYFCAASLASLKSAVTGLRGLKTELVMIDLVGNEAALGNLLALWESEGFRPYTQLCRMARASQSGPHRFGPNDTPVVGAEKKDAPAISDLLCRSFDRHAEQLPMLYEIESAIENRQILVVECEGRLGGLLFFETHGFTSTVRYWLVAEEFRASHLGSALMRHYFATQSAVRRFVLWVIADNANAVQKYQHYGFIPDGLIDYVLANEKIRP
jgi:ribosomal protein S18 acetylase RimI-like enzyme